jgi:hypothetical protein
LEVSRLIAQPLTECQRTILMLNKQKQEDTFPVLVTALEAHMLKIIRSVPFGEIVVSNQNSAPFKVSAKTSVILKPEQGQDLIVK